MKMNGTFHFTVIFFLFFFQNVEGQRVIYFEDSDFNFKPTLLDSSVLEIRSAFVQPNGAYWVNYVAEEGILVKYIEDKEVFRSAYSGFLNYNERPIIFPDNSIWVQTSVYMLSDSISGNFYLRKFLVIDAENNESFLDEGDVFDGGKFLHFDKYKNQYYALGDSLRRYNADFSRDYTFKCEIPLAGIGTVLVNKYGSVFLGNDKLGISYNFNPTTYKLDYHGNMIWEGVINKKRNQTWNSFGDYNMFYPLFEKENFVLWGSLRCGEGCYTADNHALTEEDERVELPYLQNQENNFIGVEFIDKYGVTVKNGARFMKYDSLNRIFDENSSIIIDLHEKSVRGVFPDSSILVQTSKGLSRYTTKINTSITTEIVNLKEASDDFFNKKVIDVRDEGIDLEIVTSDGSDSYVFLEPESNDAAYLVGKRLVFTGKEGEFRVLAYSYSGSVPYESRTFYVTKTDADIEVITTGPFYVNVPLEFQTVQSNVYLDSVSGSCINLYKTITATSYSKEGCSIYYSWGGDENHSSVSGVKHFEISEDMVLGLYEQEDEDFFSFPNPIDSYNKSFIISSKEQIHSILAFDLLGHRKTTNEKRIGKDWEVSVDQNFSGVLIIYLFGENEVLIGSLKKVIQ